jgi:nitrite reductase/ring-hydroxylating ferredoxin subunit
VQGWIDAGPLEAIQSEKVRVVRSIAVFAHEDRVFAVDNRCPHLGFPLHLGSVCDGMLTCHWHHARFDLCSGGTLDPWADDVPAHDVRVIDGRVWVNPRPRQAKDREAHARRLREGLEQNIGLVIAKAIVGLVEAGVPEVEIARIGIEFGVRRNQGWNAGLVILTAMARVLPKLDRTGRILALYHGLSQVARSSAGRGHRYLLGPLPSAEVPAERLMRWYRQCVEVRDTRGAERILLTAIGQGMPVERIADMMLAAVTDHFYLDGGHTFDFHNKALEALQIVSEEEKTYVLAALTPLLANPTRSEERHPWRAPVNLVQPLLDVFPRLKHLPQVKRPIALDEEEALLAQLLSDQPLATIGMLAGLLEAGVEPAHVARVVALAAAERIARFHTQNEFSDWVEVLHTFTHAHAVHERVRHGAEPLVLRAVFHGAMAVYLDRFLNVPAVSRPEPDPTLDVSDPSVLLKLLERRQSTDDAARWVVSFLAAGGDRGALLNALGHALLREDAEFHSFQMYEAAVVECDRWAERSDAFAARAQVTMLVALARYLAAHAPTARELPHTAHIAMRLGRGEKLFEAE